MTTFLIDGYNLMHAAGLLTTVKLPAGRLEPARGRLLDWLADASAGRGERLRVVFDAARGLGPSPETEHKGVRVRFAYRETADDLIEHLLATDPRPAAVMVVSNDTRLHEAARRAGSRWMSCEGFVDWLVLPYPVPPPPARDEDEKPPAGVDPEELDDLLRAFTDPAPRKG